MESGVESQSFCEISDCGLRGFFRESVVDRGHFSPRPGADGTIAEGGSTMRSGGRRPFAELAAAAGHGEEVRAGGGDSVRCAQRPLGRVLRMQTVAWYAVPARDRGKTDFGGQFFAGGAAWAGLLRG